MPRRNKRKDYSTSKAAVFYGDGSNAGHKPGCVGCAFAGYGGVCMTSDGTCLKTTPEVRESDDDALRKR
jgi:hypothetical protein